MEPLQHLLIIWCGVFVAVIAANKTKLTPVLYFLAIGSVLVNLGVLPTQPHPFIRTLAEVGIIVIMFALGFEENTNNFLQGIKRSWGIALFGAITPFLTTYLIADYFWNDTNLAMMCGLAMTATAVSLTMVSLKSAGLQATRVATGIMTSTVIDAVGSMALVAILVPVATGNAPANLQDIAWVLGKAVMFFALVTLIGGWIFPYDTTGFVSRIPILRRFGIRHVLSFANGEHGTLTVLTIALAVGILAHAFGFHPAVGAYMAGLVLKEEYFHFLQHPTVNYHENTKRIVDNAAYSWIGPVFFVDLGTKIVFEWDVFIAVIPQTMALIAALFVAQITSASLAARHIGRFTWRESVMIGFGMLGRAELAFVVMDIAYVQYPILTKEAFYTLMFTAFWLNVSVPVTIAFWKPHLQAAKSS